MVVAWIKVVAAREVKSDQIEGDSTGYADGLNLEYVGLRTMKEHSKMFSLAK